MSTENKPLLSDERLMRWANQYGYPTDAEIKRAMSFARDIYEADRAKTRAVVQRLVDDMQRVHDVLGWHTDDDADPADTSPDDSHAHTNGLIRQSLSSAIAYVKSELNIEPTPEKP